MITEEQQQRRVEGYRRHTEHIKLWIQTRKEHICVLTRTIEANKFEVISTTKIIVLQEKQQELLDEGLQEGIKYLAEALMEEMEQLKTAIEIKPGSCKMLSKGDACDCTLCRQNKRIKELEAELENLKVNGKKD